MERRTPAPVGELLRHHRIAAALSQEALAERAGLSVRAIGDLERGIHQVPRLETVRLLADALRLDEVGRAELLAAARPQVMAPGDRERARGHPLTTREARPNNLPLQPTPFVGREDQVARVVDLLSRDDVRLLTLTGPGGIGKTRLALQAAVDLLDDFVDGVFFVPLAPLVDPHLVPATIAGTLGVREEGERPLVDRLREILGPKQVLLLVDNFEHVVEAAPIVGDLLVASPGLKVVATSRVPLRLRAEHAYPVPPLSLPRRQLTLTPEQLSQYEAVRLFIERAQAVRPDFTVDNESSPAVAEICWKLDGLPLAIELAAARVRILPPHAMLLRLEQWLPFLTGGARDAPARQRTLRDTIAWSFDLLESEEQLLFQRLAIFVGGCSLEAAEAVTNPDGELDVLGGMERLIEHNLMRQEQGADGEPRFTMLETIREFGLEELSEDREVEPIQRRHAEFYARLAEEAEPVFLQMLPDQATWLVRFDAEHANLRAALSWFLTDGDPRLALRLAAALSWFWIIRVHLGEGQRWLERALAAAPLAPAIDRAKAVFGASALTHYQGDEERALALGEESLALFRELGDRAGTGRTLNLLGVVAEDRGDYHRATTLLEEALTLHQENDDRPWTAHTLRHLGLVTYGLGDHERATALVEEALALNRELGLTVGTTITLIYVGVVACERGDVRRAVEAYAEALALASEQAARQGIARGLFGVASLATFQGRHTSAARLFGAGDAVCAALGYRFGLPERAQYDRARAATKRALGDERFTAIWETGRGLPAEEAVNEALALTGELVASTNC